MTDRDIIGWGDMPDDIPKPPLSPAICVGQMVYTSGQLGFGPDGKLVDGGIVAQTRATLDNLKAVLARAGCSLDDVIKTTVWLKDPVDFGAFNEVYAEYFATDHPARSTVRAELMIPDALVEIEAIAVRRG